MLYMVELFATSALGCQLANGLRYYFSCASLMWNGVEGYNMYIMLVKVSVTTEETFMTKAVVIAWGKLQVRKLTH